MRQTRAVLIVTAVLLVSIVPMAGISAADTPVSVSLNGPAEASPGETITVDVRMTAETAVYGVQFRIRSSTPVTGSVEKGDFLTGNAQSVVILGQVGDGRIRYGETRTGTDSGVTGDGTLATMELTVPASTDANRLDLSFESVKVSDPNASPVDASTEGLSVDIASESSAGGSDGSSSSEDAASTGGSGGASGGDTAAGGTPRAADTTTPTDDGAWPATVPSTLADRFESTPRVPVIVTVASDASLSAVAERLEANGAERVERHEDINSVSAVVTAETLRLVAGSADVTTVRYDSSDSVTAASADGGTAAVDDGTTAAADDQSDDQADPTTPAGEGGPTPFGFGPKMLAVGALVSLIGGLLWWRFR